MRDLALSPQVAQNIGTGLQMPLAGLEGLRTVLEKVRPDDVYLVRVSLFRRR